MKKMHKCPECQKHNVEDIICNMCGKSCKCWADYEYAELCAQWGFDSPWDCETHEAHFCIDCYKKILKFIEDSGGNVEIKEYR